MVGRLPLESSLLQTIFQCQNILGLHEKNGITAAVNSSGYTQYRLEFAEGVQIRALLTRLGRELEKGVSEREFDLLCKMAECSPGLQKTDADDMRRDVLLYKNPDNPFYQLVGLMVEASLVKQHEIHIQIHQPSVPLNGQVTCNPEVVDQVYDALKTRIQALANTETKGALFLQQVLADKTSSMSAQGKFDAVLRIIDLGAAEDLSLVIYKNPIYNTALKEAQANVENTGPLQTAAKEIQAAVADIDDGRMPRRGFFRAFSEVVMGVAISHAVDPAVDNAADRVGISSGDNQKIEQALAKLKTRMGEGGRRGIPDAELRKILEIVADTHPAVEAAKEVAAGGLAYYLASAGDRGGHDPLTQFLAVLADECDQLSYPVLRFGTPTKTQVVTR